MSPRGRLLKIQVSCLAGDNFVSEKSRVSQVNFTEVAFKLSILISLVNLQNEQTLH